MNVVIIYKNCKGCKGKNTFMCDEYDDGEYFNFCIRCGFSKKNIDKVKSEVSKCEGTLRYALKEGSEGFQVGPLSTEDISEFTKWSIENKDKLDYSHITFPNDKMTKWFFHNLITNEQTDYEIKKDYLFGKDIERDPKISKKKKPKLKRTYKKIRYEKANKKTKEK